MPARAFRVRSLSILVILCAGLLLGSNLVVAQDTLPTETPTLEPTPTLLPTDMPTDIPTDVPTVTPVPPTAEPTVESPTLEPTLQPTDDLGATPVPTVEPTVTPVLLPPAFDPLLAPLAAIPGQPLVFTLNVTDESGAVRVLADPTGMSGAVTVEQGAPVETLPPFITPITVTYLAASGFSGVDSFALIAIDQDGMQTIVALQVTVGSGMTATPTPTATPSPTPTAAPGGNNELVINFNPNASPESIAAMLAALNAVEVSRIPALGAMKVMVPDQFAQPAAALAAVNSNISAQTAGVTMIEPNIQWSTNFTPNDPFYTGGQMPGLNGGFGIYANFAWDIATTRGLGVTVAVLDTGIQATHPDLIGQFVAGYDFVNDDATPDDINGHGTHVSGTIAARTNNGIGVAGVAFNAKIMPLKVCEDSNGLLGGPAGCFTYEIAEAMVYAADRGAKVINMSLGGPTISTTIEGAVAYVLSRNVTVVAAAGNTGDTVLQYPASYSGVISVAAHDPVNGDIANFSTNNSFVTISAPGVNILSTYPTSNYAYLSGTSMATPHVAGIAALLIGKGTATTPAQIREALICSALDLGTTGRDDFYGHGAVQADFALTWSNNSPNCKPVPVNDTLQGATRITTLPAKIIQPINFRTIITAPGDGVLCGDVPSQNVWFTYTPTVSGAYQINTVGSSYDTQLYVLQGSAGAMRCVANNDDFNFGFFGYASHLVVDLQAGQTYTIMVDTFGIVDSQLLQLNINPVLMATGSTLSAATENNGAHIAYSGTWVTAAVPGASPLPSGGTTAQTTDNNAWSIFTIRGYEFEYYRTVGPDQGSVQVVGFDLGGSVIADSSLNNNGPLRRGNQASPRFSTFDAGRLFTVAIRRNSAGFPGAIDLDRIRVYDQSSLVPTALVTTLTDDRDLTRFRYNGTWTPVNVAGSNANTAYQTTSASNFVTFQGTGSALTIWRNVGPGFPNTQLMIDGRIIGEIINDYPSAARVPFVYQGLSASNHIVRLTNVSNGVFQFDAAGFSSPLALAASTASTNENSPSLLYSGTWTSLVRPGALLNTTRATNQPNAAVEFSFTGNRYCVLLVTQPGGGLVDFFVNGVYVTTANTAAATTTFNVPFCSNVLYDGLHRVRLVSTSSNTVEIDGIRAQRQVVLTPASGVVNETATAFTYTGAWSTVTNASIGGLRFQGSAARRTTTTGASVEFYVNGTGFVLYTSFSGGIGATPVAGDYQILVNGSPITVTLNGANQGNVIDLNNGWRFMPGGFGITGLPPGINRITLIKIDGNGNVANTEFADFDAIRVFP